MKIDEAIANLRKLINCRCSIYCREHCVYCENHVPQNERIASMEKVIECIEGKINGETMEKNDKRPAD